MLARTLVLLFVARLVLAPFAAADPQTPDLGPIAASAARQAEALPPPRQDDRGPMPTGLKWTGIGLLIGSTGPVAVAKLGDCLRSRRACKDSRRTAYAASGAFAVTGASLLALANAKRGPSPFAPAIPVEADPRPRRHVRHAPLWTGVGLLAATPISHMFASMDRGCETRSCRRGRRLATASTWGLGLTGFSLVSIGLKGERDTAAMPTLEVGEGRAAIVQRITF
jgi:hypothetical protein